MRLSLGVLLGTENARSLRNLCVLGGVSAVFMYGPSDQQSRDWGNLIFWLVEYWEGPTKTAQRRKTQSRNQHEPRRYGFAACCEAMALPRRNGTLSTVTRCL